MNSPQPQSSRHCSDCGAPLKPGQTQCWLCRSAVLATAPADARPATEVSAGTRAGCQFSLASLMLFMTLVAIICGIISMNPGVGAVLAFLSLPALVRTCTVAARMRTGGQPVSAVGKVGLFLLNLAMVAIVIAAAGAAFYFTFMATCAAGAHGAGLGILPFAIILGLGAALLVAVVLSTAFGFRDTKSKSSTAKAQQSGPRRFVWPRAGACPSCGQPVPAGASECPHCGWWAWEHGDREST